MKLYECLENYPYVSTRTLLNISGSGITDLEGIQEFKSLKILSCSYCMIESLKPLKEMKHLTTLFCDNNNITSLDGIQGLSLEWINCEYNNIKSLKEIKNIKTLKKLYYTGNAVSDTEVYKNILNLDLQTIDKDILKQNIFDTKISKLI